MCPLSARTCMQHQCFLMYSISFLRNKSHSKPQHSEIFFKNEKKDFVPFPTILEKNGRLYQLPESKDFLSNQLEVMLTFVGQYFSFPLQTFCWPTLQWPIINQGESSFPYLTAVWYIFWVAWVFFNMSISNVQHHTVRNVTYIILYL